jgi:predicted unusual protein kinase regulating ubiquinone biosynthesis (AarF/ABC1/UbiB family)
MVFDYFEIFLIYVSYKICLLDYNSMIKKIFLKLSTMSILFIKMFQWFSYDFTNNIWDKEDIDNFLKNCLNKVNYIEEEIDREELEKLIQKLNQDNKILEIEENPSNSGTIALAFKGKLDGKNVIIKLIRKNILDKITRDMNEIEFIGSVLNKYSCYENIKEVPNFFIFNKESILNQSDFNLELENTKFFKQKYQNATSIIIPTLYYNYSNEKLIIMDYIDNINENIETLTIEENKIYLTLILKFYYNSIILKKLIHCDMHLGNILFIKNINDETNNVEYKIGIIDYGICLNLDIKEQNFLDNAFTEFMINFDLYNVILEVMKHLKEKYDISENSEIILEEIKDYINIHKLQSNMYITHYDIYTFVKISKKYNLIIPQRVYNMLLSFVSIMGTINKFLVAFENNDEKNDYLKNNIF